MNKKGFTLIELLAVIIILAVIALIATPIVLNVVDNAKESARQNSISGYADATKLAVYDAMYLQDGAVPNIDKDWAKDNVKKQGSEITCDQLYYSETYGVVLEGCNVDKDSTKYYFASGKTYTDSENPEYKKILDSVKSGTKPSIPVSNVSNNCAKNGTACTIDQIKTGVSMDVQVSPTETHKFYVLSDDGTNLTLLMDRNLVAHSELISEADYLAKGGTNWNAKKIEFGPITYINNLNNATASWTNIPAFDYVLNGNNYSNLQVNGAHAEIPLLEKIQSVGCTTSLNSCPSWVVANTSSENTTSAPFGYWLSLDANGTENWYVDYTSIEYHGYNVDYADGFGIRPTITISKSNVK